MSDSKFLKLERDLVLEKDRKRRHWEVLRPDRSSSPVRFCSKWRPATT